MSAETINPPAVRCTARARSVEPNCPCARCTPIRKARERARAAGLVPPSRSDEAWAVLAVLDERRWSEDAVGSATGISPETISRYYTTLRHDRPRTRITEGNAAAIIGHGPPTAGWVGSIGVVRRARALARIGHDRASLVAITGLPLAAVRRALRGDLARDGRLPRVNAWQWEVWVVAYDRLTTAGAGPSWEAAEEARQRGWAGPSDWHDRDLDDPRAQLHYRARADAPLPSRQEAERRRKDAARQRAKARPRRGGPQRVDPPVVDGPVPSEARVRP